MIPYTPLHLLLAEGAGKPLVMTSANHSDEPILFADDLGALAEVADAILTHDRPIRAFADDSVARRDGGRTILIRRSRGFVPLPLQMPFRSPQTVLGLGGMLKGTFAFLKGDRALISPYIGTLDSPRSLDAEKDLIDHFAALFKLAPDVVAVDMHPLYPNRRLGDMFPRSRVREVQHHRAHVAALLAERKSHERIIGIAMDGTGYGDDGKIWGGEFFVGDLDRLDREGHLRYLFLPSGDLAIREPWRFSLSLLHAIFGAGGKTAAFAERFGKTGRMLLEAISHQAGGVGTSSCGRLFDGVASLLGLGDTSGYDGELPALLQTLAETATRSSGYYPFSVGRENGRLVLNLLPAIAGLIGDGREPAEKARMFHRTLARGFREMAERLRERHDIGVVGLSGGVFQNMLLLKMTVRELREGGFRVLTHSRLPANDGCLSLGQACLARK
jgi:hydrogenase maturation protein HypF